ncbi:MAG TPA: 4Fe-4S dicluster domain-containing protein, partial [Euryarchaeota archaeon]|nr:4Fe-4S dicluster domain-containing protein [Euryarchaeota archaeon]
KYLPDIFRMCLSGADVDLLLLLPGKTTELAESAGEDLQAIRDRLETLFRIGFVVRRMEGEDRYYDLVNDLEPSILPGNEIFKRIDQSQQEDFLDLWDRCFEEELVGSDGLTGADEPQLRVIPIERTIPMKWGEVLPQESLSSIIGNAKKLALTECSCRVMARKCDNPTDVCMLLDDFAEHCIERGSAHEISINQAIDVLMRCEELGLVHQLNNSEEGGYQFICNCCSCCCTVLRGMVLLGKDFLAIKSRYVSSVDESLCMGCDLCERRCQFHAIRIEDSVAIVDQDRCFGCGLCVSACPTRALKLVMVRGPEHITDRLLKKPESVFDDLALGGR